MKTNLPIKLSSGKLWHLDVPLLAILVLAMALRLFGIGFQGAWLDELHTLIESDPKLSLRQFNDVIMFREGIPHFYFLVIRFLSVVFGDSLILARLVSAFAGIGTVYGVFCLGRELYSRNAGYIAALLISVNLFHIEYSQEARSYAMLTFFVVMAFYRLMVFIRVPNYRNAVFLGIFAGLIPNAHPIGLVNVVALYVVLFVIMLLRPVPDRKLFFKLTVVSGIIMLAFFFPVYFIVAKVSGIQSFWIPAPTLASIIQVFTDLSGYSRIMLAAFCISGIYFFSRAAIAVVKQSDKKLSLAALVLSAWLFIEAAIIIGKSYTGVSIILNRYFIALLPAMMLIIAISICLLPRIAQFAVTACCALAFLYVVFIGNKYYTTFKKSQFSEVANGIMKSPFAQDKLVSNWGWLMGYYFHDDQNNSLATEKDLEKHISDMSSGNEEPVSFWYMDGNYRPFSITPEAQKYLDANFVLTEVIEKHDAWARHFKTRRAGAVYIDIHRFRPAMFDGSGALIFVQNQESSHPAVMLDHGRYQLSFKGFSLPEKPIRGENAHFVAFINDRQIGEFYLPNGKQAAVPVLTFEHSGGPAALKLRYDNDLVEGPDDRNAVVNAVILKKVE